MTGRSDTAAVLLAGGLSRRMGGGDKCLRSLAGHTLLERVVGRVRPQVAAIVLNANGDPGRFAAYGLRVIADPVSGNPGPLAGVLAGLEWAAASDPRLTHVATIAADTPFFPADLVARLHGAIARTPSPIACAASRARLHPVFGLWPVELAADLRCAIESGVRRVADWTARHGIAVAHFDDREGDPFFNINTEADLEAAERRLLAPVP